MNYDNSDCNKFVQNMKKAGYEVKHYQGRNFYTGPSVTVPMVQDAISATKVKCQWDNMGKQFVVYPVARGTLVEKSSK